MTKFTVHDFNNKTFTIKELKELLNKFDDDETVEFLLFADACWDGGVNGELSVDVNNETIFRVNL